MPDNLPAQLTSFIGREREMAAVGHLLAGTRLLTLTGAGGVGKTRLAVEIATSLSADYADGVWLVELAALADPALVPATVAAALGLREEPGRPLLTTLTNHLHPRSLLLLVDNCEHLVTACAVLTEALLRACPQLQILVTTRQPLAVTGETTWPVPPMAVPSLELRGPHQDTPQAAAEATDAVRLFAARATAANPQFHLTERNGAAVAEICRRLDGIPLALELAAARMRALTVEQVAARLTDRFRLLTMGSRTALPRQQTLRGTLDWSYELLSEPERVLLRRLTVFAGGWTLEAAEQICAFDAGAGMYYVPSMREGSADPPPEILDLLTGLVEKSLVLVEEQDGAARYRLLETIRQYGLERLEASEEVEVLRRCHAEHCLTLVEEAEPHLRGPLQAVWLDRLQAEHDNLRAALDWLAAHDPEHGLRLGAALWRFWDMHGHISEGRERLAALLERGGTPGRSAAWALQGLGTFARKQGDFDITCRLHEEGLAICRELDDRGGAAHQLNSLALARKEQGDLDAARALASESLTIMREVGDDWGASIVLNNLGLIIKDLGDIAAAAPLEEESLALKRRIGDLWGLGIALNNLGVKASRLGDLATARTRFEESLAINRQLGNRWGMGYSLRNLGEVARLQGDHDAAGTWFEQALRLASGLGDRRIVASCLHGLGAVAVARGTADDAAHLFGAAAALRDAIGLRLPEQRRAEDDQPVDTARAALGEEAFAALWAEGWSMQLDQAVAHALSVAESRATPGDSALVSDQIPLSAREREVAVLLAQGLTNRRIADQLVVATSTVDRHVVNILRKLDLTSRAQVAAWAVENRVAATSP